MTHIKGKQIKDNSLDLDKIKGGSKVLPSTATLGSAKTVEEITELSEFTTKGYVDAAVATNMFELIAQDGTVTYGDNLQTLVDNAPYGSTIILHAHAHTNTGLNPMSYALYHNNGVHIDTNSFDIPYLIDGLFSDKFRIYGNGRIGRISFTNANTEVDIHCNIDSFAFDPYNPYEGYGYNIVNCKRFVMHGDIIMKHQGNVQIQGSTIAEIYKGGCTVKRSPIKPAASAANMYTEYGDGRMLLFKSTFAGQAYVTGTWHSNSGASVVYFEAGCAGTVVFDQVTITNYVPYPMIGSNGAVKTSFPQGIVCDSGSAKLIFRGTNNIHAENWLDVTVQATTVVEIEGEVIGPKGFNNNAVLTYKSPVKISSTGYVYSSNDAATMILTLNKGKHHQVTLGTGTGDRTIDIRQAQTVDNWTFRINNCAGQKLKFAGIQNGTYYIFGSTTQITHITLPTTGFAIIEFYKNGTEVFIKSDVTTKQYRDAAALAKHTIEITGGTATNQTETGVVAYSLPITFSSSPAKTTATVHVNGVQLKLTEQVFFSTDGTTRKDVPATGDTLYFDLDATSYSIEADDDIIITYFV